MYIRDWIFSGASFSSPSGSSHSTLYTSNSPTMGWVSCLTPQENQPSLLALYPIPTKGWVKKKWARRNKRLAESESEFGRQVVGNIGTCTVECQPPLLLPKSRPAFHHNMIRAALAYHILYCWQNNSRLLKIVPLTIQGKPVQNLAMPPMTR